MLRMVWVFCAFSFVALGSCARLVQREPASVAPATDPLRLQEFLDSRRDPGVPKDPKIGPGDVIAVQVADVTEASREYTVSRRGTIRLPFAGEAKVAGKSAEEASEVIAEALQSVVVDPAVAVELIDVAGGEASIEGAVERPGKVRLGSRGRTLLDALAAAGGLSADAAGVIRITPGSAAPPGLFAEGMPEGLAEEPIEISANDVLRGGSSGPVRLYLRAGDRIEVVSSQSGVVADAGPDPLAELGLASADATLDEEREEPRRPKREPDARTVVDRAQEVDEPAVAHPARRTPVAGDAREPKDAPSPVARARPAERVEDSALRADLDALRRRLEANEVALRNQVRRVEGESAQRHRDLTNARVEAEQARRQAEIERQRSNELTSRIIELESARGGPATTSERPISPPPVVVRSERSPAEPAEASQSGGLLAWFRGGEDEKEAHAVEQTEVPSADPEATQEAAVSALPPSASVARAPSTPPRREPSRIIPPPSARELPRNVSPPPAAPPRVNAPAIASAPPARMAPSAVSPAPAASVPAAQPAEASQRAQIAVVGRVRSPGNQSLAEGRTVTRAVMRAGLASGADVTQIVVQRGGGGESWRIRVNLTEVQAGRSPDLLLQEGDTIVVP